MARKKKLQKSIRLTSRQEMTVEDMVAGAYVNRAVTREGNEKFRLMRGTTEARQIHPATFRALKRHGLLIAQKDCLFDFDDFDASQTYRLSGDYKEILGLEKPGAAASPEAKRGAP